MKKTIIVFALVASIGAALITGVKSFDNLASVSAEGPDEVEFVLSPRKGQGGNFSVESTFSAVNVKFNGGITNRRSMLYANCTNSGTSYIDISSYASNGRLEYLFLDGSTTEHVQPFLVDKDGRTYTFGTTDDASIAGSAYYEYQLSVTSASENTAPSGWAMNNNSQFTYNYHGFPVNYSAHSGTGSEEFVYYHLNLANRKYKSGYTEWASGLNLSPADTGFDFTAVKLAGFWMNKQCLEETSENWDIKLLEVSVRSTTTGARTVLFDAKDSVVTTSNSTLWNDRVDTNGNSYVYIWNNPDISSYVTLEVGHTFKAYTVSQARPLSTFNNGLIYLTGSVGSAWLWAFAKDYNRFAAMNCTGFDGTIWHIDNTTGEDLKFDWYFVYNGNQILNKMWLFPDDGNDASISNPVTTTIPAGFKGWVYSLFEQNVTVSSNLASLTNTTRFVVTTTSTNLGKYFTVDSFKLVKNASALKSAKVDAKETLEGYDSSKYRSAEQTTLASTVSTAKAAIYAASDVTTISSALSTAVSALDGLKTDAAYDADDFVATLRLDTYDPELNAGVEGPGTCATYFDDVKSAYEALSADAVSYFWGNTSTLYINAQDRFVAWCSANGYSINEAHELVSASYYIADIVASKTNIVSVILIASLLTVFTGFVFVYKKKKVIE